MYGRFWSHPKKSENLYAREGYLNKADHVTSLFFHSKLNNELKCLDPLFMVTFKDDGSMHWDRKPRPWLSAQHYYLAKKFSGENVREEIRNAKTIEEAIKIANKHWRLLSKEKQKNWFKSDNANLAMAEALYFVFTKKPELKQILLNTGNAILVYDSKNPIWGRGSDGKGENRLGLMLMRLRSCKNWDKKEQVINQLKKIQVNFKSSPYSEFTKIPNLRLYNEPVDDYILRILTQKNWRLPHPKNITVHNSEPKSTSQSFSMQLIFRNENDAKRFSAKFAKDLKIEGCKVIFTESQAKAMLENLGITTFDIITGEETLTVLKKFKTIQTYSIPQYSQFFQPATSYAIDKSKNMNLLKKEIKDLTAKLDEEIYSLFPYPNKDLKVLKREALYFLLDEIELGRHPLQITTELKTYSPEVMSGFFTHRVADLFEKIEKMFSQPDIKPNHTKSQT